MKTGESTQLQRVIGYFHGTIFLFSIIIGAGIFIAPKGVLKYTSLNVGVSLIIWAACAIVSMIAALSYAELGTTFPISGAQFYFLKRSLGSIIAFFYLWISLFSTPAGLAARGLLLAGYILQPFFPGCFVPEMPKKCLALAILWCLGILNARGVKEVAWFQTITTLVKMAVLCFISVTGIVLLIRGRKENVARFENAFDAEVPDALQIAEAFLQGLYAYSGWGVLVQIAGELKNPSENINKCVVTALTLVAVIYLLVNISYIAVLTPKEIMSSDLILLINYVGFINWLELGLMMIGLLKLRYQEPNLHRPYRVRLPLVFGTMAMSFFLVLTPTIKSPTMSHIYAFLFIFSGLLFYLPFGHFNLNCTYFNKITCFLQLLLNVSPADDINDYISEEGR
ncbi:solute carrier family 7 member 13 isoform X2 [Oryctolagus cuniculus]|uniref:solute carrier family 7 member 13 isoform X2 n=1 Tax=Oryctolagus cuniculus TaxID=9986 RepID=UPI00048FA13D|nr:solute carrier family 7 member 13 isoform X2 [Oryctolagus cuniculus]